MKQYYFLLYTNEGMSLIIYFDMLLRHLQVNQNERSIVYANKMEKAKNKKLLSTLVFTKFNSFLILIFHTISMNTLAIIIFRMFTLIVRIRLQICLRQKVKSSFILEILNQVLCLIFLMPTRNEIIKE